jgi:hypothetical protein
VTGERAIDRSLLRDVPSWVLVALFLVLAVAFAAAGQLDDWLRAVLAATFGGIALALATRLMARTPYHPMADAPAQPPPE